MVLIPVGITGEILHPERGTKGNLTRRCAPNVGDYSYGGALLAVMLS